MTPELVKSIAAGLTANEAAFLKLCLNYDTIEQQMSDNYSNGGIDEACHLFAGNRKAAGGLLSSLNTKKLGWLDTEYDQFGLTELGVHVAFATLAVAAV